MWNIPCFLGMGAVSSVLHRSQKETASELERTAGWWCHFPVTSSSLVSRWAVPERGWKAFCCPSQSFLPLRREGALVLWAVQTLVIPWGPGRPLWSVGPAARLPEQDRAEWTNSQLRWGEGWVLQSPGWENVSIVPNTFNQYLSIRNSCECLKFLSNPA